MQALELRIPPPVVVVLTAGTMWGISLVAPLLELPAFVRIVTTVAISLVGVGLSLAGVIAFRRARTTVNPMKPQTTSSLVCSGIYRVLSSMFGASYSDYLSRVRRWL